MPNLQRADPRRVLIVEDQIAIALEIEAFLQGTGFTTVGPATNVGDAAALVEVGTFHVAVLDVGLVENAIHDVLWPRVSRRVPIVFLADPAQSGMPTWAPPAEYVTKPCRLEDIREKVTAAIDSKRRVARLLIGPGYPRSPCFLQGKPGPKIILEGGSCA